MHTNLIPCAATGDCAHTLQALQSLTLDDAKVTAREHARPPILAPWPTMLAYRSLCWVLDALYAGRPIQRFWVLENVARIPYHCYLSVLHLYESLGWWRKATELKHLHFAEVHACGDVLTVLITIHQMSANGPHNRSTTKAITSLSWSHWVGMATGLTGSLLNMRPFFISGSWFRCTW